MKKLTFLFIVIICISSILIIMGMGLFAYNDVALLAESQKSNMLNFSNKYDDLLESLNSYAENYIITNDQEYKTHFFLLRNEYLKNDNILLKYSTPLNKQFTKELKSSITNKGFTLSTQAALLGFTKAEQETYAEFLQTYNLAVKRLTMAVNVRDINLISNVYFNNLLIDQSSQMSSLCKSYFDRINNSENLTLQYEKILKVSLTLLALILLILASFTFYVIIRENRYNSYFRKLYNTVVENINVGICIFNQDYRYEYINPMYREIMCITRENSMGNSIRDLFNQNVVEAIESFTRKDGDSSGEVDLTIDNKKKHIVYYSFSIKDESGSFKHVNLVQDTTDTENMQSQLKKQLKEIAFYSHAKDIFIANMSHEIKTPINAILGMLHFLKNTKLSQSQRNLVNKIESSSDILLNIINDVLDLSKIKFNTLSLYPSDFALIHAIKNAEDMFTNQIVEKGLNWFSNYEFNENLCIHLDKTRLVQVLVNLLNNAYKFTDRGFIKLSVEVLYESFDFVQLQFCVEDTGIGIAEKDISRLFHEFEQIDNHLTKQHQGTGLGLFICKNITESLGGRMWVKSVKGEGSKFYFTIPAKKAFDSALLAPDSGINCSIPLDGSGGRALIVEDTEINAEVTVKLLNDVNVTCDTAVDGLTAIQMCKTRVSNYYTVILMDIHMPNMDGYTAAYKLKKELGVTSPIIAITASEINEQIRQEHKETIDDFILKPFKVSAFYNTLSTYFSSIDSNFNDDSEISNADFMIEKPEEMNTDSSNPFAGRDEAIKNLGGHESIYSKHLKKFKVNYIESYIEIKSLLDDKRYDDARRCAHNIKGLSGTLGMTNLHSASAALEKGILKGEEYDLSSELDIFNKELKAAIAAI